MPGPANPFLPGNSGNPSGRPRVPPEVKALLKQHGIEAVKKIVSLMDSDDERIALAAASNIADRAFGKATQPIAGDDEGDAIKIAVTGDEARNELAGALARLARRIDADAGTREH